MNRNKLIDLFVSNISNVILHRILEKAIHIPEIASKYHKEVTNSYEIAKKYREKINPTDSALPAIDIEEIKRKISTRVRSEIRIRTDKGYKNIDLGLVDSLIEETLGEMKISKDGKF
jgi:hypothetical protein